MIDILYFARLRERLGVARERLPLPAEVGCIADLLSHLSARGEPWTSALAADSAVLTAVNQELARADTPIADGDEIALFPPVTGG